MGHYASEVGYYDREDEDIRKKKKYKENLKFWQSIYGQGHIDGRAVEEHLDAIIAWYKVQLYDLRYVKDE